jgi:hypothetical protein
METLEQIIDQFIEHIAHTRGWSREDAKAWIEPHIAHAREAYREHGTPFGESDAAFVAWLQPRYEPPTA